MYLTVDVGGTKTLLASFDGKGKLAGKVRFVTPEDYEEWLRVLEAALPKLKCPDFKAAAIAIPGSIDRMHGVGTTFGNLPWRNVPVQADTERILHCPVIVENDAKVAGLYEALTLKDDFKNVLFITIGTGVGIAYITNGVMDLRVNDLGGAVMLLSHKGQLHSWDSFASGKAIVRRFHKKASEITDAATWKLLAKDFATGIIDLLAKFQPDVIVIGGGVGSHFVRFGKLLKQELSKYETPLMPIPPIKPARHTEEAVLYGCYELIRERYAHAVH